VLRNDILERVLADIDGDGLVADNQFHAPTFAQRTGPVNIKYAKIFQAGRA
jgi:hypothetical protein